MCHMNKQVTAFRKSGVNSPCYSDVTLWLSEVSLRRLVAPRTYSTSGFQARSYCDDIGYQTNSERYAK